MKVYFPTYYKDFNCIADRCTHSCCIDWEITLDADTAEKYRRLGEDYSSHLEDNSIALCEDGRCPFLMANGLCRIIANHGEEMLSEICHHHPRFYHRVGDRVEGGIGISCEEAARIVLSSDGYADMISEQRDCQWSDESDFDTISHRQKIYSILCDRGFPLALRLDKIKEQYGLTELSFTDDDYNSMLSELEYLHSENIVRLCVGAREKNEANSPILERFFAYLVFRHISVADSYDNLRARLAFCILLLLVLENFTARGESSFYETVDFARMISEEIEYSEDNTASLIFEFETEMI